MWVGVRRCDHTQLQARSAPTGWPRPMRSPPVARIRLSSAAVAALPDACRLLAEGSHSRQRQQADPHHGGSRAPGPLNGGGGTGCNPRPELSCKLESRVTETFPSLHSHRSNAREPPWVLRTPLPHNLPPARAQLAAISNQSNASSGGTFSWEDATCHSPLHGIASLYDGTVSRSVFGGCSTEMKPALCFVLSQEVAMRDLKMSA